MPLLAKLKEDLLNLSNPKQAELLQRFFKTKEGEYGHGDVFLGIKVPETRKIALKFKSLPLNEIEQLLNSKIHEERLCALLILVHNFENNSDLREKLFNFYLSNTKLINNWDLVDLSAPKIVGCYLSDKDKSILYELSKSDNIWERRISIISTLYFINKDNKFSDALKISEVLITDKHDLIHKAVGWMLREIGKKDMKVLEGFLIKHYKIMPRTMLRYAIEKFPEKVRKAYLKGDIK